MLPLEVGFAALFGLAFGSFLNVCIVRLPKGESIVQPASHCRSCHSPIQPRDNLPVLSWILLRGRSRCCGQPIAPIYPLVEIGTALLFVASILAFGVSPTAVGMMIFCWLSFGLLWMDFRDYLLPDAFTLPGIVLGCFFQFAFPDLAGSRVRAALISAASAIAIGGVLLLTAVLYKAIRRRDGMGLGDVKLGAMLGAWLGWRLGGVALFIAILGGAATGLALTLQRSAHKDTQHPGPLRLPFGSFLAASGILTVFAGKPLLAWYMSFFP